jgi:hypothetical protein
MTDLSFTGMTYENILTDLKTKLKAIYPDFNVDSEYDLVVKILEAVAYGVYQNNVLLELVANESMLETLQTKESLRKLLKLVGYNLQGYKPATGELLLELTKTWAITTQVLTQYTKFGSSYGDQIYEVLDNVEIDRNDRLSWIVSKRGANYVDLTSDLILGNPMTFFPAGATLATGDEIYFGHNDLIFDTYNFDLSQTFSGGGAAYTYVWEYYDGDYNDCEPDVVDIATNPGQLTVELDSLLGTVDISGATVRIQCILTGEYEDCVSTHNGITNIIITTDILGQSVASSDPSGYIVGVQWHPINIVTDGTVGFSVAAGNYDLEVEIPDDDGIYRWANDFTLSVLGTPTSYTGVCLRFRVIDVSVVPANTATLDHTVQENGYLRIDVEQGKTYPRIYVQAGDGTAGQSFLMTTSTYIEDSIHVWVDSEEWQQVESFYSSSVTDKNYTVTIKDEYIEIIFGDGINGLVPAVGKNIEVEYRYFAVDDGNLGAKRVNKFVSGGSNFDSVYNPQAMYGWSKAEGVDTTDLERMKTEAPNLIWTRDRAVTSEDIISLCEGDETLSIARAEVIEDFVSPGISLVVAVGDGATYFSIAELESFEEYFNGDLTNRVEGKLVLGHEVRFKNFRIKTIDITATVTGDTDVTTINNYLLSVLTPLATVTIDGITRYRWELGGGITLSMLSHLIFESDDSITNVSLALPVADVVLDYDQLPQVGTIILTII